MIIFYNKSKVYEKAALAVLFIGIATVSLFATVGYVNAKRGGIPATSPVKPGRPEGPNNPVTPPGQEKDESQGPKNPVTPPGQEKPSNPNKGPKNPATPPGKNR